MASMASDRAPLPSYSRISPRHDLPDSHYRLSSPTRPLPAGDAPPETARNSSLLHPRVAVVLNVPRPWHPWLFALRLSSILPAIGCGAWGLVSSLADGYHAGPGSIYGYPAVEMGLAMLWCFASGYLAFFFTDCLMSRWLLNYTPQATIVRLLTINVVSAYGTASILSWTGGFDDCRLHLVGWITIATTLTFLYHVYNQRINIRKETSASINVFSIASFISMVALLILMHASMSDYPEMPFVTKGRKILQSSLTIMTRLRQEARKRREEL